MKHVINLAIKFFMLAIVLAILLPSFTNVDFNQAMVVAILLTIAAYIIGDMIILPTFGNAVATVADAGLAAIVIWGAQYLLVGYVMDWTSALITGAVVGVGEYFFHRYLNKTKLR